MMMMVVMMTERIGLKLDKTTPALAVSRFGAFFIWYCLVWYCGIG